MTPALVNTATAAMILGYSRSTLDRARRTDRALAACRVVRAGRRPMWSTAALASWAGSPRASKPSRLEAVLSEIAS